MPHTRPAVRATYVFIDQVRCSTPACVATLAAFGPAKSAVYELLPLDLVPMAMTEATHHCRQCGGYSDGQQWVHECRKCERVVAGGELVGPAYPTVCCQCAGPTQGAGL